MTGVGNIERVLSHWRISLKVLRPDIIIAGSPERTAYRVVIEDKEGRCWLLEKIPAHQMQYKLDIIRLLEHLTHQGFRYALPYHPTTGNGYHAACGNGVWQLVPFLSDARLDRPRYVFDTWRGPCMADCLITLRKASGGFPTPAGRGFFSITKYIGDMTDRMARHNPGLLGPVSPVLAYLQQRFFPQHDALPVALCHGDYHPLNILWKPDTIIALIDWEFFGLKPEGYDVANMVGCLGMEDPESLSGDMVCSFLGALKSAGFLSAASWQSLPDLILALRFAWLSEWLRNSDTDMIDLELTYMYLLMDNRQKLKTLWEL